MIRIENLHKRFGDVRAVDGVSFCAADGQVTALLGPNGAGKTTTLRMLYTLMRPDEGQILVDGIDAVADPQGARFALGVLPDQSGLYPRLTAREHIEYFGELQGVTGADLRSRTDHLLKMLDMAAIADRRVAGFSHGERTKTALARAIVHNPKNVLLDEPTNGLDVMSTRAVREIIRRLKEEGHTVLFSSHVMQEVSALCDTIVVIARGRIVGLGSPDDLRRQTGHENLEDAFVALSGLEADRLPKRWARRRRDSVMNSTPTSQAIVVIRKELRDWSRDRRSIITVLASSLLAPALIFFLFNNMASRQRQVEDVTIPIVGAANAPAFVDWLRQQAGVTVVRRPGRSLKKRFARGAKRSSSSFPRTLRRTSARRSQRRSGWSPTAPARTRGRKCSGFADCCSATTGKSAACVWSRAASVPLSQRQCRSKTSRSRARSRGRRRSSALFRCS